MHIHELHLPTNNLDQQHEFYTHILDLPHSSTQDNQFTLRIGASKLVFSSTTQTRPVSCHFAFNIPENQFPNAKQWLADRVPLLTDRSGADEFYFAKWNAHAIYFADPAGNIGEFISRHELSHPHTQEFTSCSPFSISEVGLVVDDVTSFVQMLQATVGSSVYRTSINEQFTPLGDEHGLLIVVKRGRLWFPEIRVAAMDVPLAALISDGAAARYRIEGPPYRVRPA